MDYMVVSTSKNIVKSTSFENQLLKRCQIFIKKFKKISVHLNWEKLYQILHEKTQPLDILNKGWHPCFEHLLPHQKRSSSKWTFWIKVIHSVAQVFIMNSSSFFLPSTIWPIQSQFDTTTFAFLSRIANMFTRGICLKVAPSPIQLSPNMEVLIKIDSLFFLYVFF